MLRLRGWYRRPAFAFAIIASTFGTLLALTLPAFGGYDEGVHFMRAWQVSDGGVFAREARDDQGMRVLGGYFPAELEDDIGVLGIEGILRRDGSEAWSHVDDDAPNGRRIFLENSSAAVYSPVPYLPSAIAILAGRFLGVSTLALVLLARLAGFAVFVALVTLAIHRFPGRKWTLALLALLPAAIVQATTVSADGITAALTLLLMASAFALWQRAAGAVPRALLLECALVTVALSLSKPPYILVAALLLPAIVRHRGIVARALGATLVAAALLTASWSAWAEARHVPQEFAPAYLSETSYAFRDVDPDAQLEYVRSEPWSFVAAIGRTFGHYGDDIAHDALAQTTWWRVPWIVAGPFALTLVLMALLDAPPAFDRLVRLASWAVVVLLTLALFALAYAGWNAVRAPRIDGFQGRYLFPVLALVLVVTITSRFANESRADRLGPAFLAGFAGGLAVLDIGLVRYFYG